MKAILLSAFAIIFATISSAQVTEGHVSYRMELFSDEEEIDSETAEMLKVVTMELYFTKDKYRMEYKLGSQGSAITISDGKHILTLYSYETIKMAEKMTVEESDAERGPLRDYGIAMTDSTREILGYTCRKLIVDGIGGKKMETWITDKINIQNLNNPNFLQTGQGFPLQYETYDEEGYRAMFTAIAFTPSLENKEDLFSTAIPEGYTELPMEGIKAQQEEQ
jgi:outer membrane lipoprotein-sorting protein